MECNWSSTIKTALAKWSWLGWNDALTSGYAKQLLKCLLKVGVNKQNKKKGQNVKILLKIFQPWQATVKKWVIFDKYISQTEKIQSTCKFIKKKKNKLSKKDRILFSKLCLQITSIKYSHLRKAIQHILLLPSPKHTSICPVVMVASMPFSSCHALSGFPTPSWKQKHLCQPMWLVRLCNLTQSSKLGITELIYSDDSDLNLGLCGKGGGEHKRMCWHHFPLIFII